jgi:hypothetical protein
VKSAGTIIGRIGPAVLAALAILAIALAAGLARARTFGAPDSGRPDPAGDTATLAVADVYRRAEQTLRRPGALYHATIQAEADMGFVAYSGTTQQWVDERRNVARQEAELGPLGRVVTLLAGEARYVREKDGRFTVTPARSWTCHGAGVAASAVLGCPGPTERSHTEVQQGRYDGRPAIVLVTTGTSSGSDELFSFTKRLYLDPDTHLPLALESEGQVDFGQVRPTRERRIYKHGFIAADAVPPDFFDPASIGYAPPNPAELLNRASPDLTVYWLGGDFPGAGGLPALVLARVDAPVSPAGPGYRFILNYARADDPFGPPLVSLQLWPRAAWDSQLARSRGMNFWEDPCFAREEIALRDGRATVFSGFASDRARLPADEPRACPTRPYDTYLAHAYLGRTVVFVTAPRASGPSGIVASPYDTREGVETVVRALQRHRAGNDGTPPGRSETTAAPTPTTTAATIPGPASTRQAGPTASAGQSRLTGLPAG